MPSPSPNTGGSSSSKLPPRELSPYFSLPNEDGESNGGDTDQLEYPPVAVSCANCERIVGDSSAFLYATRQMGTITLSSMVSVIVGDGGLKTSLEGEWDEFCNYKNITCGKCAVFLGKMYMATTAKLSTLQNKYTLPLTTLSFYHHASRVPSLPPAQTQEIYSHLHPSPESTAENIDRVMTMCVMLHEKQSDIIRGLKKVAMAARVDVDLDDPGEIEELREGIRDKIELLEKLESKLTLLDGLAQRVGIVEAHVEVAVARKHAAAAQHKGRGNAVEKRDPSPELGMLGVPNFSRKRKSASGSGTVSSEESHEPRIIVDLSREYQKRNSLGGGGGSSSKGPQLTTTQVMAMAMREGGGMGRKRTKRISHSPDVLEVPESEVEVGADVEEDEEEDEEEKIKSPIEKKRRGARAAAVEKASRLRGRLNA
ncbi:hypothetical protein L873DRAFT_1848007 [Choiromyces venosus 120613-1]|uniref:Mis18 domain-containing protein n=1 Tax=Choiromyces venosus 120613-1 TaxID=1336337 RepID=A0A3N4J1J0_9PEZI|nr:hypothetical protein L873DRAFT_1848007 [Choiromyces venosus 120613-1]